MATNATKGSGAVPSHVAQQRKELAEHDHDGFMRDFLNKKLAAQEKAKAAKAAKSKATAPTRKVVTRAQAAARKNAPRRVTIAPGRWAVCDGTAVIPVAGVLFREVPKVIQSLGIEATSTNALRVSLDAAASDKRVKRIALVIDSHGGTVAGMDGLIDEVERTARRKPVQSYIDGHGLSAAYWIAARAGRITATPTSTVGSIGVYTVIDDDSRRLENMGIQSHVVASGSQKAFGDIFSSRVSAHQLAPVEEQVQGLAKMMVDSIADARKLPEKMLDLTVTGRPWLAADAQGMGLVDSVGPCPFAVATGSGNALATGQNGAVTTGGLSALHAGPWAMDAGRLRSLAASLGGYPDAGGDPETVGEWLHRRRGR